ncbi:MAG: hypothetical protein U0441_38440 [Polyangiaceae bacterium]
MDLHEIARQVVTTAGADFGFVLSQAGLLVTRDAPRDMPDRGRQRILWACPPGSSQIAHVEMPREDLVPYGGAAPIDVFAIRVEDTAILVVVVSSWNDKSNVVLALTTGASALGDMIRNAKEARAQKASIKPEPARRERPAVLPAEPPARRERTSAAPKDPVRRERTSALPAESRRERTSALPAESRRERTSALPAESRRERTSAAPKEPARRDRASSPKLPKEMAAKKAKADPEAAARLEALAARVQAAARRREARARAQMEPEITVGEATIGRETLVAIEEALPPPPPGPSPESVRVELESIGPETMIEIRAFEAAEKARVPTVEQPIVFRERTTLPYVDASAVKRKVDAEAKVRGILPPEVKVTVEDMDPESLKRALAAEKKR